MREYKFRAYDTYTKTMLPIVDIIKFTKSEDIYITRNGAYGVGINIQYQPSIEIMQYTGLKDKNGKEIYEGDILRFSDVDTAVVEWNEKYTYFMVKPIQDYYLDSDVLGHAIEYSKVEMIGNIYENSNLLKD